MQIDKNFAIRASEKDWKKEVGKGGRKD
jgi:hypothetical protein